jgi:hypothetical protein
MVRLYLFGTKYSFQEEICTHVYMGLREGEKPCCMLEAE